MLELVFTSAKAGLIPGRSGFCSVAWTEGMPQNLVSLLENMSGYNALYMPNDPKAELNPVCYSYQKVRYGHNELRILSRIAFAGLDYTGRTNKIAHHIIIEDDSELASLQHGPVSAFLCEENFITEWNEPPRLLPRRTRLKSATTAGLRADQWHTITGYPQWAGIVAERFLAGDEKSCLYLEYDNEVHRGNVLPLIDEIVRVLPPGAVADFTFNTYFTNAQNGIDCFFRAALPNSPALPAIKRFKVKDLISLVSLSEPPQDWNDSPIVGMAVDGVAPVPAAPVPEVPEPLVQEEVPSAELQQAQPAAPGMSAQKPPEIYQPKYRAGKISYRKDAPQQKRPAAGGLSPQVRLMLFAGGALLLLCLIGGGVWFASQMMKERKASMAAAKNKKDESRDNREDTPQSGAKKKPAAKKKHPAPETDGVTPESTAEADGVTPESTPESKPEEENAGAPAAESQAPAAPQWTLQDEFEFYKKFKNVGKKDQTILLPEVLKGVTAIRVELKPGWGSDDQVPAEREKEFCTVTDQMLKLHPANHEMKPDTASTLLEIRLDGTQLVFAGTKVKDMLEYVSSVTFVLGKQEIVWKNEFKDEFCDLILENGKFAVDGKRIKFICADEDVCVKSDFEVKVDDLIEGLPSKIRQYKDAFDDTGKARKAYEKEKGKRSDEETVLYTWEDAKKTLESLQDELEKDAKDVDFDKVERLFKTFVEQLKYLDPKEEGKFKKACEQAETRIKKLQEEIKAKKNNRFYRDFARAKNNFENARDSKKAAAAKKLKEAEEKAKDLLAEIEKLEKEMRLLEYYSGVKSLDDIIQNVFDKWKEKYNAYDALADKEKPKGDDGKPVEVKKPSDVCKDLVLTVNDWRKGKKGTEELKKRAAIRKAQEKYEKEDNKCKEELEELKAELEKKKELFADLLKKLENGEMISLQEICDILNRQKKDFVEIKKKN